MNCLPVRYSYPAMLAAIDYRMVTCILLLVERALDAPRVRLRWWTGPPCKARMEINGALQI
jgi:hypothetical protein